MSWSGIARGLPVAVTGARGRVILWRVVGRLVLLALVVLAGLGVLADAADTGRAGAARAPDLRGVGVGADGVRRADRAGAR